MRNLIPLSFDLYNPLVQCKNRFTDESVKDCTHTKKNLGRKNSEVPCKKQPCFQERERGKMDSLSLAISLQEQEAQCQQPMSYQPWDKVNTQRIEPKRPETILKPKLYMKVSTFIQISLLLEASLSLVLSYQWLSYCRVLRRKILQSVEMFLPSGQVPFCVGVYWSLIGCQSLRILHRSSYSSPHVHGIKKPLSHGTRTNRDYAEKYISFLISNTGC